ncbi:MAG TPA: family 16 glycoside hydrolase [Chitinophaga sp.]|uniref:DUF1080 domain-containing protein n=1 Tax=Chitinophaga sp. TaxID=1869181 RepID=UPI002DBB6E6D|nr:family 16 glycoside hydrolase [Chitinophaga sp.]HEU4551557.1 family 16 glycoside hydrolase [Chitinophaga sp.]
MKQLIFILICCCLSLSLHAQAPADQRTVATRIADALAQLPAKNGERLNAVMAEITAMGEKGLAEMAGRLVPEGQGDNTRLEYALAGYAHYVTQPGQEAQRAAAARAFSHALESVRDKENKAFLIKLLQITGGKEAVPALQAYLADERLCDPAARALLETGAGTARQALLTALSKASGSCQLQLVTALGHARYNAALPVITPLATAGDARLRKVALYALAGIGDERSAPILAAAAEKSGYTFDETEATAAYLHYAQRLAENGADKKAADIAATLLKKSGSNDQVHTRTAALQLLAGIQGAAATPLLLNAADDRNSEYREAALKLAARQLNAVTTAAWIKKAGQSKGAVKAAIITMLGHSRRQAALPLITASLKDRDAAVREAAAKAAGSLGDAAVIPALLNALQSADAAGIANIKAALLTIKGATVTDQAAAALKTVPPAAQAALLEVLAARMDNSRSGEVLSLLNSTQPGVKKAAFAALPAVTGRNDLDRLFPLLLSVPGTEAGFVQQAIMAGLQDMPDSTARMPLVLQQLQQAPADRQYLFYNILAGAGGPQALQVVENGFNNGNEQTKRAAVAALSSWANAGALDALFRIAANKANSDYAAVALKGYLSLVRKAAYTPEMRLLQLRRAMDIAPDAGIRQAILKNTTQCKTFTGLVFAGRYLDDAGLQQAAAAAVMNIALSSHDFSGKETRRLLEKVLQVLKGADSDYQKEAIRKYLAEMPAGDGLVPMFNGQDLEGWKGLVADPLKRAKMSPARLAAAQQQADEAMRRSWSVKDGLLVFSGKGDNLCTVKKYGDFEMYVDWKITPQGDAGIYLRGTPQVQIWDTSRRDVGAQVGSGGLYNNQQHPGKPLVLADNAIGEWNTFHITMKGDRVTVYLNGRLVVDNTILENYWDRNLPIFPEEQIELQAHGTYVAYRDLYIREIPRPRPFTLSEAEQKEGFKVLFDGTNMHEWTGNTHDYVLENGNIVIYPQKGGHGNLYTKDEYSDFNFRFEFQLTPGANNGLGVRAPLEGNAAYEGMELQILDNEADIYKDLHVYQYHGSVYGVIPAKRGYLKPAGEWNQQEVILKGSKVKVILNGTVILDGDIAEASRNGTADGKQHPGLKRTSGHIGFLGHGSVVRFRNIRIRDLSDKHTK